MSASVELLARVTYFAELEPDLLELLAKQAQRQTYRAEQVVFLEGKPSQGLYVVEQGWLKGSKFAESGREQVLRYFGPGEAINEISLFLETPNPATVIALEASTTWLLPRQTLLTVVLEQPTFLLQLTQNLAKRLLYLVHVIEDLSLLPLEARVAKFLLEYATEDSYERRPWATQAELAARLGTVPDVLHRVLRGFSEAGLIEVQRQQIMILDKTGLEAKANLA